MKQYVALDKRSKKAQKEYHARQRMTWGELNPITRSVPSGKVYNRKKERRIGVESRDGFEADFFKLKLKNISKCDMLLLTLLMLYNLNKIGDERYLQQLTEL